MYGLENRFKMQVLLGLKRAHCEMGIQQIRTTPVMLSTQRMLKKNAVKIWTRDKFAAVGVSEVVLSCWIDTDSDAKRLNVRRGKPL